MSDLIVSYNNVVTPPQECSQEPPPPTQADPNPKDGCFVQLSLADEKDLKSPHLRRFDRQGKKFVLSSQNSSSDLTWFSNYGNTGKILNIPRVVESMMRSAKAVPGAGTMEVILRIAQYVVTGKAVFSENMEYYPEIKGVVGGEAEMASYLLEFVSNNSTESLQKLFGVFTTLVGDPDFAGDPADRIRQLTDILALRPAYLKFREHFSDKFVVGEEFGNWKKDEEKKSMSYIFSFSRKVMIDLWKKRAFAYDKPFLKAFQAYQSLPLINKSKETGDFCARLEAALKGSGEKLPEGFSAECRRAGKYLGVSGEAALKQSLRDTILHPTGRKFLQELIKDESSDAGMSVDWLHDRGRIGALLDVFIRNMEFTMPEKEGNPPEIKLNVAGLKLGLDLAIQKEQINQREYILSALALVRRFFLPLGAPRSIRVFYEDEFVELTPTLKNGDENDIKNLRKSLEKQLSRSEKRTEKFLPILEASTCIAGVGGLVASETVGSFKNDMSLQFGIGITSSGVAGAGCSALVGHYVWPKFAKVRNRYMWEGLTGAGGAIVGVGLYFLIKSFTGDRGDPTKFPVDEYGP